MQNQRLEENGFSSRINKVLKKVLEDPYSGYKLFWHLDKLKSFEQGKTTPPLHIRVKPTNECNHHCFFCSYDPKVGGHLSETFKRKEKIPKNKMMEILEDFKDMDIGAVTYSGGGEPLIYPWIENALEKSLQYGLDLGIITNGQKLDGKRAELLSQAKWVRVSVDWYDAKSLSENRRVPESFFHELESNIQNFAKIKDPKCELGVYFIVHHKNAGRVYDSIRFFRDLGANNVKISPAWVKEDFFGYHSSTKEDVLKQIAKSREEIKDPEFKIKDTYEGDFSTTAVCERTYSRCYVMETMPVIAADSKVYFCHDKSYTKKYSFGSLEDKSFKDLWLSEEISSLIRNFNPQDGCRHYCTNDSRNIFIHNLVKGEGPKLSLKLIKDILKGYGNHMNFI